MKTLAVYNPKGEITKIVQCPEFLFQDQTGLYESAIDFPEGLDPQACYVYRGQLHPRQPYSKSILFEGQKMIIHGLPIGTRVQVDNLTVIADAEPTEIEFELGGKYQVELRGPAAYLPENIIVNIG